MCFFGNFHYRNIVRLLFECGFWPLNIFYGDGTTLVTEQNFSDPDIGTALFWGLSITLRDGK